MAQVDISDEDHTVAVSAKAFYKMQETKKKTGKSLKFQIDEFCKVNQE